MFVVEVGGKAFNTKTKCPVMDKRPEVSFCKNFLGREGLEGRKWMVCNSGDHVGTWGDM